MKNSKLIAGLFLVIASSSLAQTESFTLDAAKSYSIDHHISIKNSQLDVEVAQKQIVEIRGMGLPQVNITGSFNNFLNLPVQVMDASFFNPSAPPGTLVSFRAGTDYSSNANLQLTQLLFNGSYIIGLQAAAYIEKFQQNLAEISKEDVVFNVIQAYDLAAVAKTNLSFADSIVALTQELVDKQQGYFDLGMMLQEDLDQLNYSLLTAKQARVSAEVQYKNALNFLKLSMGYPMADPIEISNTPEDLLTMSALGKNDLHSNLTYAMMEKQVRLSEYNLKNDKFANLPTLNGYFQHSYNAYRNEFNFFDTSQDWFSQTSWGLQLNIPVFSGGQRYAKTAQSKIRLLKDQNSLTQMEETLKMQEMQAKNNLLGAQSKYELQGENIKLAKSIYENELTKKELGDGKSFIATQKYNQLMMAQAQYVGALVEVFQARLALDKVYNNILSKQ